MYIVSLFDDNGPYEDLCFDKLSRAISCTQVWSNIFDEIYIGYINKQGNYTQIIP